MRIRSRRDGPLLELEWVRRQLRLGTAVQEGVQTIPIRQIVGTATRSRDFDGRWRPRSARLAKLLDDIQSASPAGLDEPISVVRVDRAYFVVDGHKRVAIGRRTKREFLDAHVSSLPSPYAVDADLAGDADLAVEAILRTAREGEFRRHSRLVEAVPDARFALTDPDGYGELHAAVRLFACDLGDDTDPVTAARRWHEEEYVPTVTDGRVRGADLIDGCTDADIFLAVHRQRLAAWGTECDAADCAQDQALAERRLAAARIRSVAGRVFGRGAEPGEPLLLELAADDTAGSSG